LAFVACGNSDSGDTTGPGPGNTGGPTTSTVPKAFTVEKYPLASGGVVHEGQIVELAGLALNVIYTDNTRKSITDLTKVTVEPSIYVYFPDAPQEYYGQYNNSYWLSYEENGKIIRESIPWQRMGATRKLLDLEIADQMVKQEYIIDEFPDFTGLNVWGHYSPTGKFNLLEQPNANRNDWYRMPIPLSIDIKEHRWAWVWNESPNAGSFVSDSPGVLVSIGSFGYIHSNIRGTAGQAATIMNLEGERIEIRRLYQVEKIEWAKEPTFAKTVFYDDPTLIKAISMDGDITKNLEAWQNTWIDEVYKDFELKVTYQNKQEATYDLRKLQTLNPYNNSVLANEGFGATWSNLEFFPISRAGLVIDVTKDTKQVVTAGSGVTVEGFNPVKYATEYAKGNVWGGTASFDPITGESVLVTGTNVTINGDGGWAQWAQLGLGWTRMRFFWRNRSPADVVVPVYNRPETVEYTLNPGEVGPPLVMNGHNDVYEPPEGRVQFLNKITVSVTYTRQGGDANDTAIRQNIWSDIASGTCRSSVTFKDPDTGKARSMPTLYSPTVFNWRDRGGDLQDAIGWLTFTGSIGTTDPAREAAAAATSVLTQANSDRFASRQSPVNARISYTGWAGNPLNTRTRTVTIPVGVVKYN